jgi:hypothetical protein
MTKLNSLVFFCFLALSWQLSAQISTFPYLEDFEANDGGYVTTGTSSSWAHGVPTGSIISSSNGCGTNAWVTNLSGNYNSSESSFLESIEFDFTALTTDPFLRFDHNYNTESCCDEGWVEYSTNAGSTWTKLGTSASGLANWYNDGSNNWWDGSSSGWRIAAHVLTGLAGEDSVKFRFAISSDGSVQREGFGVDNIIVGTSLTDPSIFARIQPATTSGQYTSTEPVELSVANYGTTLISTIQLCYNLDNGTPVCQTFPSNIAPTAIETFLFTQTVDLSAAGARVLDIYISSANDYLCNDSISVNITALSCLPVTANLGTNSLTSTSAEVSWTENGTATSYRVEYDTAGYAAGTARNTNVVTDTFAIISGLMSNSNYDWNVQALCSATDSSALVGNSFTTTCGAVTLPYLENFASYVPNCWNEAKGQLTANTVFTSSSSFWTGDGFLNNGSTGSARMNIYATNRFEWLISPSIDLGSTPNTYRLEFDAGLTDFSGSGTDLMGSDDTLSVVISIDNGTTWSSANVVKLYDVNAPPANAGETVFIDLSVYTGTIKVGFYVTSTISNTDYNVYIDNFQVRIPPACPAPSANAGTNSLSSTSSEVSWTENGTATSYRVEYDTAGYAAGTARNTSVVTDTFVIISGLMSNSNYDWNVQALCSATDSSALVGNSFFTGYCPVSTTSTSDYISTFATTGATQNVSYSATSQPAGSYADETAQSLISFAGGTFDFTSSYISGSYGLNVWVDWNNDLDFDDAGELTANATTSAAVTANIPALAASGNYRMRVRAQWNNTNPPSCGSVSYGSTIDFTLTLAAPPACLAPSNQVISSLTSTGATLSWIENGTATQWEVEYDTTGFTQGTGTSTIVNTDTFLVVTGLSANVDYDWYVRTICGSGANDTSSWTGANSFFTGYCTPAPTSVDGTGITNVSFGTINNATGAEVGNYGDYSSLVGDIAQNTTATVDITLSTGFTYDTQIWIDWNDDLDFSDAGETVYTATAPGTSPTTLNATFSVPASAPLGQHRMRIGGGDNPVTACYNGAWASFEDYTVNVIPAPACLAPSANAGTNSLSSTSAEVSWTENGTATSYRIEYDTAGYAAGTARNTSVVTDTFAILSGLMSNSNYDWNVQALCSATDSSGLVGGSFFTGYCTPAPTSVDGIGITNVSFDTVNNTTGAEVGNYGNYSSIIGSVAQSTTASVDITFSTGYTYVTEIWVDWNNDLDFDDAGENVYSGVSAAPSPTTLTATFLVPGIAALGQYRMRIGGSDVGPPTPCYTGAYASYEDYTLNVTAPPSCLAPSFLVQTIISGDSVEVSWTDPNATMAPSYEVSYGAPGFTVGSGTQVIITTNIDTLTGLTVGGSYDWYVRSFCSVTDTSTWVGPNSFRTPCSTVPAGTTLPFMEDWESNTGTLAGNGNIVCDATYSWNLETNNADGRARFGADAVLASTGIGAVTLDAITTSAVIANDLILTIDLAAFSTLTDLELLFDFAHHGEESHVNDSVWVRGNSTDSWVGIYDLYANRGVAGVYNNVTAIDIDAALAAAGQTVSSSFQVRFGQEDNFPATSPIASDGFSFDNITIRQSPLVYYTIGTINTEDVTGVADSAGVNCAISGTVVGVNRRGSGYEFTLIDMSSGSQEGITVFDFNSLPNYTAVTEGDSLYIEGDVAQFNGLTQFSPDTITLISSGNTIPAPIVVSDLDETTESKWLSIPTQWVSLSTSGSGSSNISLTNGTDTILMRIDSDTDVNDSLVASGMPIIPGDTICGLFGIGGQFDNSSPFTGGYQIFPMRWSDLTICRLFVLPYYPIATINTEDATGVADSTGVNCAISGTVVGVNRRSSGYEFTLIDMSSGNQEGITVFDFNSLPNYTAVTEGDSLYIEGDVAQFNGLTQFSPDTITLISSGNTIPAPNVVSDLDETTESKWLSIPTSWISLSTSGAFSSNVDLTNGTDTITMRIDSDTDINDSLTSSGLPIVPGDTICGLLGVGGQFDGSSPYTTGYQIFPMRWTDLTICRLSTGINEADITSSEIKLVPNPTNGSFEIRSNGFNNPTINISIRDINGRVLSSEFVNDATGNFNKSFDLNGESSGVYFITILDGQNVINKKLILQ